MPKRFNTRTINREIAKLGGKAELVHGKGYWYFMEGEADWFHSQSVYTYHLSDLTLEDWIGEWKYRVLNTEFPESETAYIELQNKLKGEAQ